MKIYFCTRTTLRANQREGDCLYVGIDVSKADDALRISEDRAKTVRNSCWMDMIYGKHLCGR